MIWALLIAILCAAPNLDMRLEVGIDGLCKRGGWVDVRVEIQTGEEWLSGRIKARIEGENVIASAQVHMPPYARRAIRMSLPAPDFPSELRVAVEDEGGETVITRKSRVFPMREQDMIIAVISDVRMDMSLIDGETISVDRSPLARSQIIRAVTIPSKRIGRTIELAPVDLILLHSYLPDEGIKELRRWVASGGALITCKGFEVEGLTPARLRKGSKLRSIKTPLFPRKVEVVEVDVEPEGKLLLSALPDHLPLMVSKRFGDGMVLYIAFDPLSTPFISPQKGKGFWKQLIIYSRPPLKLYRVYDPQHRFQRKVISSLKGVRNRGTVAVISPYLAAYTVILFALVALRRRLKGISPLMLALVGSLLVSSALIAQITLANRVEVRRFAILRASRGEKIGFKWEWLRLSSRFKSSVKLKLKGRRIAPIGRLQTPILLRPEEGNAVIDLNPFMDVALYAESMEEFSGISMRVEGDEVDLINDSPYDVSDLIVSSRRKFTTLNYLASGVRARVQPWTELSRQNLLRTTSLHPLRKKLFESVLSEGILNYLMDTWTDFLIGWLEGQEGEVLLIYQPF
jgi:hypothetical protein